MPEIPIGFIPPLPEKTTIKSLEQAVTKEDRRVFDQWIRERWTEKDELMENFYREGQFEGKSHEFVVKVRGLDDLVS